MFVLCPHCQFLVGVDPRTGHAPATCPRCGLAIEPEATADPVVAQTTTTQAEPEATPVPEPAPAPEPAPLVDASTPARDILDFFPPDAPAKPEPYSADALIAAMSGKPARKPAKPKSEPAKRKRTTKPAAPPRDAAKPAPTPEARAPRAPQGPTLLQRLRKALQPAPKPSPPQDAAPKPTPTPTEAAPPRRKATVKPIRSLRERARDKAPEATPAPVVEVSTHIAPLPPAAVEAHLALPPLPPAPSAPLPPPVPPPVEPLPPPVPPPVEPLPPVASPPGAPVLPATPAPRPRVGAHAPSFARTRAAHASGPFAPAWQRIGVLAGLALLLVLQLLLAQRDVLARDARWRPLAQAMCATLRCALPDWRDPAAFTILARDVRPHPRAPGALQIAASFRNDARWAQAWPELVLSLSDVDGRVVGTRAFSAREYLGGAPTQNTLAPGQTAAVSLAVVEPAPGIVSFGFEFR